MNPKEIRDLQTRLKVDDLKRQEQERKARRLKAWDSVKDVTVPFRSAMDHQTVRSEA